MSEIEKEDSEEEHIPTAFSMDDVTIDVEQYGEDEQIVLTSAPAFESIITSQEPEEEEYELTAADIPEFVQKFEKRESFIRNFVFLRLVKVSARKSFCP